MGEFSSRVSRERPGNVVGARPRRDGQAPKAPEPRPTCGRDQLNLSSDCRKLIERTGADPEIKVETKPPVKVNKAERTVPVVSDDQMKSLLKGQEAIVYPNPGTAIGNAIIGDFRVVGYAIDQEEWNRMGRPEGYIPIAYLRTHLEIGPVGGDIKIRSKNKDGQTKLSVGVNDITWNGEKVEKLAKDFALKWAKEHPEQAIPTAVVIVAGGLVGAYYYSKKTGPVEFSVGSIKLVDTGGFDLKLKAKAEVDVDPWAAHLNGAELRAGFKIPEDWGKVEAGARYNFQEDRWRLEAHYGLHLGEKNPGPGRPQGYLGVGAWAEQVDRLHGGSRDRDWDYGVGLYAGFNF